MRVLFVIHSTVTSHVDSKVTSCVILFDFKKKEPFRLIRVRSLSTKPWINRVIRKREKKGSIVNLEAYLLSFRLISNNFANFYVLWKCDSSEKINQNGSYRDILFNAFFFFDTPLYFRLFRRELKSYTCATHHKQQVYFNLLFSLYIFFFLLFFK